MLHDADEQRDAMVAATVALACSGTVTTELALAGAPVVVAYRLNALTHAALKRLIRTRWITLFNIAAGEEITCSYFEFDPDFRGFSERAIDVAISAMQAESFRAGARAGADTRP